MRVKCVLCDDVQSIDGNSLQAKRMRNRRIHTYMCPSCNDRIGKKTNERKATGNFKLYREPKNDESLI
ncbi:MULTISPECIES: YlaI family protein [Pontibacillus]|uniref:YlaI family protein n=1 Tax=Pontibacillus chungwhensis TaxID=265426 RepID=A0ABY8V4P6_9BACI|nr:MULTISPECIES: YlaI family protein [Pontibacillus]MCD5322539.1 YlaI family protein [Pontibacillus sp. HN14]WIF99824.1 YlaI family protein [Pontibacillus chungwhensis]